MLTIPYVDHFLQDDSFDDLIGTFPRSSTKDMMDANATWFESEDDEGDVYTDAI